jgi:hypothetical protein
VGEIDSWLERLSWIALVALPFLFVIGGYVALTRLRDLEQNVEDALQEAQTSTLLDVLRLIDRHGMSDAQLTVLIDIREREQRGESWWESDDRLHRSAERVCATYDCLGGVINFDASDRVGPFFLETWGEDVIRIHDILERYLGIRRKSGDAVYNEFTWLAQEAKLIHRSPPREDSEHPIRTVIRHLRS